MQYTRKRTEIGRMAAGIVPYAIGMAAVFVIGRCVAGQVDEPPTAKADAPPDQAIVGSKLGGSYFVPKPLKQEYENLVGKVRSLEAEINEGRIEAAEAAEQIRQLRDQLDRVRKEIESKKQFVPAAKIHTQSETTEFNLGGERCLLIVADRVRLVGWDKPQVKCVLEKVVLSAGNDPVADQFGEIQLVHRHGPAADEVGRRPEEIEAEEQQFLASPDGKKLSPAAIEFRRQLHEQMVASQAVFSPLQGKEIDVMEIRGLTYQEGNRQILLEVGSAGGETSHSSAWQRHASLTVYLPAANVLGLKGGLGGLEVESVSAALVIKGEGNRDYDGQFGVRGLQGSLTAEGIGLQTIDDVKGNVSITAAAFLGNSGTRHSGGARTSFVEPPEPFRYTNIEGDLQARFVRGTLHVSGVSGRVDVSNEFGDTLFIAESPLASQAHRIVSDGGHIEVKLAAGALGELPVVALTECGLVRTGDADRRLEDVHFTGYPPTQTFRRALMGFATRQEGRDPLAANPFERGWQALLGRERSPGLDLISRGGSVTVERAE